MIIEIVIAVCAAALIVGVFVFSNKQYKDEKEKLKKEKKTLGGFLLEILNHLGDSNNFRR